MTETRTEYKIRRTSNGLFSTGGTSPRFNTKGKVWRTMQALSAHLALSAGESGYGGRWGGGIPFSDLEVVEFQVTTTQMSSRIFSEVAQAYWNRKLDRRTKAEAGAKRSRLRRLEEEAAQLRQEIG